VFWDTKLAEMWTVLNDSAHFISAHFITNKQHYTIGKPSDSTLKEQKPSCGPDKPFGCSKNSLQFMEPKC
jgi:hypothetical protein